MNKLFAYFFLGFVAGLIVVELTDGKPAKKANHNKINQSYTNNQNDIYPIRDKTQEDTFNSQRRSGSENENNGKKN
tara:strand:+ start:495 stop:722 length:228 start_codon:yes stop_codon:yes gene_type:complete